MNTAAVHCNVVKKCVTRNTVSAGRVYLPMLVHFVVNPIGESTAATALTMLACVAGDNKLCAVHVDDAVRAFVSAVTHTKAEGIYNIVGENGITGKNLADTIAAKLKCKTQSVTLEEAKEVIPPWLAYVTSLNNQVDNSKTRQDLDWTPQHQDFKSTI